MQIKSFFSLGCIGLVVAIMPALAAEKSGSSTRIHIGIVEQANPVRVEGDMGPGALIGGLIGWGLTSKRSSGTQAAGAIAGTAVGAAVGKSQEDAGMRYSVRAESGAVVSIVTDQTQVRVGDCVAVEDNGKSANIRRVDAAMCQAGSAPLRSAVSDTMQGEASQCHAAKQELLDASTADQLDLATRKVKVLCNE